VTDYRSPLLTRPGAVSADALDTGVAWHYGDPLREQRALAEEVGWVDRSHRGVLQVSGDDRRTWLHSLTTQHLSELPDHAATEALVLDHQGHVEHHAQVAEIDDAMWLDVEPGTSEALVGYLDSMRFWSKVEVADVADQWAVISLIGPETARVVAALGVPEPGPQRVAPLPGGGWVRRMSWPGDDAADLLIPRERLSETAVALTDAGARPAGTWAFEALRVEARRPRLGLETDHRTIPHEVGWIGIAVHLEKGCYRGQETVARVHNLGRPPRRLVLLHLDGAGERLPSSGAELTVGDRVVGFVGTAVRHYELGSVALAVVKRNVAESAEPPTLLVDGIAAAIDV
jgi:folate-binding protein YgfZ